MFLCCCHVIGNSQALTKHTIKMGSYRFVALAVAAFLALGGRAREMRPNILTSQLYDSGAIHKDLMAMKMVC